MPLLRRKPTLPAPRHLPWRLRDCASARHSIHVDHLGRLIMRIEHADLPGLTPQDLCWWFGNIDGDVVIGSATLSRYHAWHPGDHIHWALARPGPTGRAEAGARFHITEALGRNMAYLVDVIEDVTRLDRTGITLEKRVLGQVVSRLSHDFGTGAGGASYRSCLTVGFETPGIGQVLNPAIRRVHFPMAMGRAWIRHNIEEVGLLEHLVPLLRDSGSSDTDPRIRFPA